MKYGPRLTAALLIASVSSLPGCLLAAAGAGAGAAYYYTSSESTEVEAAPQEVVAAALEVVDELELTLVSQSASGLDGEVVARTARDEKVQVDVRSTEAGTSKVTVRVGLVDETSARRILDSIVAKL